jgi:hypothetical protein
MGSARFRRSEYLCPKGSTGDGAGLVVSVRPWLGGVGLRFAASVLSAAVEVISVCPLIGRLVSISEMDEVDHAGWGQLL